MKNFTRGHVGEAILCHDLTHKLIDLDQTDLNRRVVRFDQVQVRFVQTSDEWRKVISWRWNAGASGQKMRARVLTAAGSPVVNKVASAGDGWGTAKRG